MTSEQWDEHWHRIREDAVEAGALPTEAEALADAETIEQFGTRPEEKQ